MNDASKPGLVPTSLRRAWRDPRLVVAAGLLILLVGVAAGAAGYRAFSGEDEPPGDGGNRAAAGKAPDGGGRSPEPGSPAMPVAGSEGGPESPGDRNPAQFTTDSMYPAFNPERHYYVTRCVPGKVKVKVNADSGTTVRVGPNPAGSGEFTAEARPLPGQDFRVVVDSGGETRAYEVRCLPAGFPEWSYRRFRDPPKGRFLVSFRSEPLQANRNWVVVFDQDGTPRWWFSPPTNTLGGQVLGDGTVQWPRGFGDGFGQDPRTAVELRSLDGRLLRLVRFKGSVIDGHEYVPLPGGDALVMSYAPRLGVDLSSVGLPADSGVLDGAIEEVDPSGKVVWSWNSKDHVPLADTPERWWKKLRHNPHPDPAGNDRYDIFHLNSIEPWGRDQLVISSRHTDKVYGISRRSGRILWTFGGVEGPESLELGGGDPRGDHPIAGNHDARISDGNLLSIHDNGTNVEDRPPRLVRYRINLRQGTATYAGQLTDRLAAPESHCCGSARPFGTGWLLAWGDTPFVSAFDSADRLAFRLGLPGPSYRAVPVPASVSDADLDRGLDRMEVGPPVSERPVNPLGGPGG